MELSVDPEPLTVDVVPTVRLTGAAPGTTATLTISTVDAAGHNWRSTATIPSMMTASRGR